MSVQPQQTSPHPCVSELAEMLAPLPVFVWGELAMSYLGVPVYADVEMIVVCNEDFNNVCQSLDRKNFQHALYAGRVDEDKSDQYEGQMECLDAMRDDAMDIVRTGAIFEYPDHEDNPSRRIVAVFPNYFIHFPLVDRFNAPDPVTQATVARKYDIYGNIYYPSTAALLESLIYVMLDEDNASEPGTYSSWGHKVHCWLCLVTMFLKPSPAKARECHDPTAVSWYLRTFGPRSGFRKEWAAQNLPAGEEINTTAGAHSSETSH